MGKTNNAKRYSNGFDDVVRTPKFWLTEAQCQIYIANILFEHFRNTFQTDVVEYGNCSYRTAMFHAGLAIENAAKAVLIQRNPNLIQDKILNFNKLCGKGGHGLVKCVKNALSKLSQDEEKLLTKLEQFVIWAGKYYFPKNGTVLDKADIRQSMRIVCDEDRSIIKNLLQRLIEMVNSENSM